MSNMISSDVSAVGEGRERDGYESLLSVIRNGFEKNVGERESLFRTDADGLYDLFLRNIPEEARQHYNCDTCRHFVNHYGGIVTITEKGGLVPVMWTGTAPAFFKEAVAAIKKKVSAAKVTGVFITGEKRLGIPTTGHWTHMSVDMPKAMVFNNRLRSSHEEEASKNEDRRLLCEAVGKYSIKTVETAVTLLRANALYRSEKILGVAEWFQEVLKVTKGKRNGTNKLWRYAASAPVGFCHVSSSMIGTLLDDIEHGYNLDTVKSKFDQKMDPTQYQRPQAKPTAGNVAQAEKIVEKLGIENSLKRRFARLDELETIWMPSESKVEGKGVFAGVEVKGGEKGPDGLVHLPNELMTWEKFRRTVLPNAKKIEFLVSGQKEGFSAIVTAVDPDAPPIIQWDTEERRNPFNWYVYNSGSYPGAWNLKGGFVEVTGIVLQPNMWQPGFDHHGKAVFFILKDCKDTQNNSLALFPEVLKADLHEVRATIAAFSRQHSLEGAEEASACGIRLRDKGKIWDYIFQVTTDTSVCIYKLDRWD